MRRGSIYDEYKNKMSEPLKVIDVPIESAYKDVLGSIEHVSEMIDRRISTDKEKSIVDKLKDTINEDELVKIICTHARNTSATIAKPYLFFLLEKYGCGFESAGLGGFVESGFSGLEKDDNWEVEQ